MSGMSLQQKSHTAMSRLFRPTSLIFISHRSHRIRHLANRPLNWYVSSSSLNNCPRPKHHLPFHVLFHRATLRLHALSSVYDGFLRFTSGATPAGLSMASTVTKPFLIHILAQIQALAELESGSSSHSLWQDMHATNICGVFFISESICRSWTAQFKPEYSPRGRVLGFFTNSP